MLDYCKREDKKRDLLMMDLVRRIECNMFAVLVLTRNAVNRGGTTYLKLPVGLLIRTCLSDCIMGLYVSLLSGDEVEQLSQTLTEEYVA